VQHGVGGNQGGYRSKDYREAQIWGPSFVIGWRDIGTRPVYLYTPLATTATTSSLPFRPVDSMLVGPYPPTHGSSYLFHDAMERRGRSRAVPTTAVIRKSHHHQRQLYYSRYSPNPRPPSPSPTRSLQ